MKILVTAESTIDLPNEILDEFNIKTTPFTVILKDKEYKDGEITTPQIFEFVEKNNVLPKTSAVNVEQYQQFFAENLKKYDAIIHISLSSQISSACQNAIEASQEFMDVYVVDSLSLSTGIALLAIYAKKLVDEGLEPREIYEKTKERVKNVQASFVIERLDYLYKGGRCSAISYFGANLLKIRPQIIVKDGKMGPYKKYRGNMDKVVANYCQDTLKEFNNPDLSLGFITYTTATPEMIEEAKKALQNRGFKRIVETHAGGTIASHCGEHTLGILYINDGMK